MEGKTRRILTVLLTVAFAGSLGLAGSGQASARPAAAGHHGGPAVTVYASGLNNPRGLTFGPDGNLYLAEGGLGGSATTTSAQCDQVPAPVGPYSGGFTSRISRIDSAGNRTTVVGG